ncbi:hypothetical protein E4T56_gene4770 [Termitomyces sp. T112]|nr:hypothetical protein E4T56_gene4770 [Termitomyces sp. T112]
MRKARPDCFISGVLDLARCGAKSKKTSIVRFSEIFCIYKLLLYHEIPPSYYSRATFFRYPDCLAIADKSASLSITVMACHE